VYAWVRVFFVFLRFINVMRYCRYTVAVLLASVVVMPVVDRMANAINLCLICLAGLYIGCTKDERLKVDYTTEFSRDVTTFKHLSKQFEQVRKRSKRTARTGVEADLDLLLLEDDAMGKQAQTRSKCIFSLIAQRKQHLHFSQLAAILCSFGMPKKDVTAVMEKYSHGHGSIDFETFHTEMQPLWEYVFFELKRSLNDEDHQEEIVRSSNAEFSRLSQAYREHINVESDEESVAESVHSDNKSENSFAPAEKTASSLAARELRRVTDFSKNDMKSMSREEIHERLKY